MVKKYRKNLEVNRNNTNFASSYQGFVKTPIC
jgi:hypothetical protein